MIRCATLSIDWRDSIPWLGLWRVENGEEWFRDSYHPNRGVSLCLAAMQRMALDLSKRHYTRGSTVCRWVTAIVFGLNPNAPMFFCVVLNGNNPVNILLRTARKLLGRTYFKRAAG